LKERITQGRIETCYERKKGGLPELSTGLRRTAYFSDEVVVKLI
jgi:hypothetical protein